MLFYACKRYIYSTGSTPGAGSTQHTLKGSQCQFISHTLGFMLAHTLGFMLGAGIAAQMMLGAMCMAHTRHCKTMISGRNAAMIA